jgi:hypothetical protein
MLVKAAKAPTLKSNFILDMFYGCFAGFQLIPAVQMALWRRE